MDVLVSRGAALGNFCREWKGHPSQKEQLVQKEVGRNSNGSVGPEHEKERDNEAGEGLQGQDGACPPG